MQVSIENSHRIANLSFALACFVVLAHVPWPQEGVVGRLSVCLVRSTLASVVIPYFSIVAGFMLAGHFGERRWWFAAVRKRFRTLLIPFAVWMALGTAILWLCTGRRPIGFSNSGLDLCHYPLIVPLWYLRALFLTVAVSPLLRWVVDRGGRLALFCEWLAVVGLMTMIGLGRWSAEEGVGGLLTSGIPLETLCYFSLGMWLRQHPVSKVGRKLACGCFLAALAFLALELFVFLRHVSLPVNLYALSAPFWLISIWFAMPTLPLPKGLVSGSFAIYVAHAVVLGVIFSFSRDLPFGFVALLGIAIPLVAFNALSRRAPRVATLLFGGRVGGARG